MAAIRHKAEADYENLKAQSDDLLQKCLPHESESCFRNTIRLCTSRAAAGSLVISDDKPKLAEYIESVEAKRRGGGGGSPAKAAPEAAAGGGAGGNLPEHMAKAAAPLRKLPGPEDPGPVGQHVLGV